MPRKPTTGATRSKVRLKEADVTKQVVDFLKAEGWYAQRMNTGMFQRPGAHQRIMIGSKGQADYLFLKATGDPFKAICLFIEFKRPGGLVKNSQIEWAQKMHDRGFTVLRVWNLEMFKASYYKILVHLP